MQNFVIAFLHMPKVPMRDLVASAIKKNKLMTSAELLKVAGGYVQIKRKAEAGIITPLGSGIYAAPSLDPFVAAVLAVAKYYPDAVISNLTALVIHGLSDEFIDRVDVDLLRGTSLRNRMLKVHRITQPRMTGVTDLKFHSESIRIYDLERTLCESYRLSPAGPIFYKALKRYLSKKKINMDRIQAYDKSLKTRVLSHIQQELAGA
jgi:predicted transcriptional regulator of viral defense system